MSPVVIATPNYADASEPLLVRMRNVNTDGFEVRVVNANDPSQAVSGTDVYYFVVEEGVYTLADDGIAMEARRYTSTVTDRPGSWVGEAQSYANSYTDPVVLGQVITQNDADFSVFWCHGGNRELPPTGSTLFTGKHVGEDPDQTRSDETIGYVVLEAGTYTLSNGLQITADVGPDTVLGAADSPPYLYSIGSLSDVTGAVVSQVAMKGYNGSWAVLYGSDPVSDATIALAVDEDQLGDSEREHIEEQVAYIVFSDPVNHAPVWSSIGDRTATENQQLSFDVTASDTDGPEPLVLIAAGLPANAVFTDNGNGSGTFSWTPSIGDSSDSPYAVTFTATEDGGAGLSSAETIEISVDPEPVIAPLGLGNGRLANVDHTWRSVSFNGEYMSPVVIATPNYADASEPLLVRMRNVNTDGFEVRVVNANDPSQAVSGTDVYYFVVEEGVYTLADDGIAMEARRYTSTVTDRPGSWVGEAQSYANSYTDPVVLGQVITQNDADFSVFWCHGGNRELPPTGSTLFTGKHVGEDPDQTRSDETIGYVVLEAGTYTLSNGLQITADVGPDTVLGAADSPPYLYSIGSLSDVTGAVVSQVAMKGYNGSWAVLYGSDPVSDATIALAVDEDQLGDSEREHIEEQVAYIVFSDPVNHAPVWSSIGDRTATENQQLSFDVTASDTDGPEPLVLIAAGLPANAVFTDNGNGSGTFSWTPSIGDSSDSPYAVTFTATEDGGAGLSSAETIEISVDPEPVIAPLGLGNGRLANVDHTWRSVSFNGEYMSPVVIATPNYADASEPLLVRMRNVNTDGFEVRVVNANDPSQAVSGTDVYYFVVEEGVYTLADDGIAMEARRYTSTVTDRPGSWVGEAQSYANSYTDPVVLGQVITQNDADFSVFWCHGGNRELPPTGSTLFTGKHVGEDPDQTRSDETIGYVVLEAGTYTLSNGLQITADVGPDTVLGAADSPPYLYSIGSLSDVTGAVVSQVAMKGYNGSWAVLYGSDPVSDATIALAVDEDQLGDSEREHIEEQVAYIVFSDPVNHAPVWSSIGDRTATENQQLSFDVTASDTDGPEPLVLSAAGLPANAVFTDNGNGSGTFSWTPSIGDSSDSPYAVTFTATEDGGAGLSSAETIEISVNPQGFNQPPVLSSIGDHTVTENQLLSFTVNASDPDGSGALIIEVCGLPENASFVDNGDGTGTFTWTPLYGDASDVSISVTFSVTDEGGIGATVSETININVQSANTTTAGFQQDAGDQGIVSIEAEHFTSNTPFQPSSWTFATTPSGFSGDGAMSASPNDRINIFDDYAPLNSPRLDYTVTFLKTGTHFVWVRGYGPNTGSDSIHIGLNNAEVPSAGAIKSFDPTLTWAWSNTANGTGVSAPAIIDVPTVGVYTINAWMREDGFIFDKIVITTDPDYVPTGTGPSESASAGGLLALPFSETFDLDSLSDWQVVDEAGNSSSWTLQNGTYQQINQVRTSRENLIESYHIGSLSYLTTGSSLQNYHASFDMTPMAETGDDIGCMIRYRDMNNFYRLSMDSRYGYTRLEKRVAGEFTSLASNAFGYELGRTYRVAIEMIGAKLFVSIDGTSLFAIEDTDISAGTFAFYSAAAVSFDNLVIKGMDYTPVVGLTYPPNRTVVPDSSFQVAALAANAPCNGYMELLLDGNVVDVIYEAPYITLFSSVDQGFHGIEAVLYDGNHTVIGFDKQTGVGIAGDYYVATGDSITNGAYDTYQTDNIESANPSYSFQGYTGPLGKLLNETNQYPTIVVNEAVGGDVSGDLLNSRIESILARNPDLNKMTLLIGTNDTAATMPPTRAVFAGNIQEIVDIVKSVNSEITVTVGITPPAFGFGSTGTKFGAPLTATRNDLIRDYRDAILMDVSDIDVGPDFFKCMLEERNLFSLFYDNVHPNGLGYDYMARLWHNALNGSTRYSDPCTPPRFILLDLEPSITDPYIKQNLIEVGDRYYIDETFSVVDFPQGLGLENGIWIMTPNADATNASDDYISFTVDRTVRVYIAYDIDDKNPAASVPEWLSGYTETGLDLQVSDPSAQFNLFVKTFTPGDIKLGGNLAQGANGADANYVVIVVEE